MTTLKQIREEKRAKVGIPLTDKEHDECFKEWLQQKKQQIENKDYPNADFLMILDELLEEVDADGAIQFFKECLQQRHAEILTEFLEDLEQ
jgi:hypothetical protein